MPSKRKIYPLLLALIAAVAGIVLNLPESSDVRDDGGAYAVSEIGVVTRVIDGDTIEVAVNGREERVRYIGIDAPESAVPDEAPECFGREAAARNSELVEGMEVRLVKDVSERDRYGRLLRYVYVGNSNIGSELVRNGFAYAATFPPDVRQSDMLLQTQREAQARNAGLWGGCSKPAVVAPDASNEAPSSPVCRVKGNISISGEKIYHVEGCEYYEKTKIEEVKGERWFCSEQEASEAGWRKARNCR